MLPPVVHRTATAALIWFAAAAGLIAVKWSALSAAHYWDALGCYVPQARFLLQHGADLAAYRQLDFVRPPLYTGFLAALLALGASRFVLHLCTCALAALLWPATYAIATALGGDRLAGLTAAALCAVSPLFFAQAGLCQSDLPATVLLAWSWAVLLRSGSSRDGRAGPALAVGLLCLAVLTKESAYFLCAPAALLQYLRRRRMSAVLPFLLPCAVLLSWELLHRHVLGYILPPVYQAAIAPRFVKDALLHNFLEGGRYALLVPAAVYVLRVLRDPAAARRSEAVATAAAVVLLPLCFSAPLPRYMLPSLPMLCALAALGLPLLGRLRLCATAAVFAVLVLSMWADGWESQGGHHLDQSLAYRPVLAAEVAAARSLAQAHPRGVLASFPMYTALTAPPEDGYLPAPLPAAAAIGDEPLSRLCAYDYVVEAAQGNSLEATLRLLRGAGALRLWGRFGAPGKDVTVWAISCAR